MRMLTFRRVRDVVEISPETRKKKTAFSSASRRNNRQVCLFSCRFPSHPSPLESRNIFSSFNVSLCVLLKPFAFKHLWKNIYSIVTSRPNPSRYSASWLSIQTLLWKGLERVQTKGELPAYVNPLRYACASTLNILGNDTSLLVSQRSKQRPPMLSAYLQRACLWFNALGFFPLTARGHFAERD